MNLVETIIKNIEENYPRLLVDSITEDTITLLINGNNFGYGELGTINKACFGQVKDFVSYFDFDNDCTCVEVEVAENYSVINSAGRNDNDGTYNLVYSTDDIDECIENYKEDGVLDEDFSLTFEEKMVILDNVMDSEYVNEVIKNDIYDALEHHPKNEIVS